MEAPIPSARKKRLISYLVKNPTLDLNKEDRHSVTPLMRAVSLEDETTAQLLCDAGASVNTTDLFHHSALGFAALKGNQRLINMLLWRKANIYFCKPLEFTNNVLTMAVRGNTPHCVPILQTFFEARKRDADVNLINQFKDFADLALYEAAQVGRDDVATFLMGMPDIAIGASTKSRLLNPDALVENQSALSISVLRGHYAMTHAMLDYVGYAKRENVMRQGSRSVALHNAVRARCAATQEDKCKHLDAVIEHIFTYERPEKSESHSERDSLSVESICFGACYQAAAGDNRSLLEKLFSFARAVDTNIEQRTLLHAAVLNNATAVNLLLDFADINCCDMNGDTVLHRTIVAADNDLKCVEVILSKNPNIFKFNNRQETVFHKVFINRNPVHRLKLLEKFKEHISSEQLCAALVNAVNQEGLTPLLIAASKADNAACVQKLIEMGAWVNGTTKNGDTALILAAAQFQDKMVDVLLKAGAKPNAQNKSGCSALTKIAHAQQHDGDQMASGKKILKSILAAGAQLEPAQDSMFRTAAKVGNETLVEDFSACKAKINSVSSSYNNTALHKAARNGHTNVVELLLDDPNINAQVTNIHGKTAIELATASDDAPYELVLSFLCHKNKR